INVTSCLRARCDSRWNERILSPLSGGYGVRCARKRIFIGGRSKTSGNMSNDARSQGIGHAQRQAAPDTDRPLQFGMERACVRQRLSIGRVIPVRQRRRLETPVPFEIVGAGSLLAPAEIEYFTAPRRRMAHELPIHKIAGREVKIFL